MRISKFLSTATTLTIAAMFCLYGSAMSQHMYSLGGASILQEVDITTRNVRDIVTITPSLSDIAFHPDGTLYGVNQHSIYRVDTTSGNATSIATIPASYGWLVGLAIDWQGKLFISALGGGTDHLLSYQLGSGILEDLGSVGYSHWDLEFYNGDLYLSGGTDQIDLGYLIQVNFNDPGNSRIVMDYKAQAYALASFNTACEGQHLVALVPDSIKFLDPIVETFMTGEIPDSDYSVSAGATSPTSYLGSLPRFGVAVESVGQVPCDGNGTIDIIARTTSMRPGIRYSLNGTDYQDSPEFNGLETGAYAITLRDSFGCTFTSDSIYYGAFDPQVSINTRPAHCARQNGSIEIALSNSDSLLFSIDGINWQYDNRFGQLAGGTYQVVIRNGADCEEVFDVLVEQVPALTHAFDITPEHCFQEDGRIEVLAQGGQGPYAYSLVALPNQQSPVFNNLHSGTYTVRTSDALGCQVQDLVDVGMTEPPVISDIAVDDAHCGQADGSVTISASGTGTLIFIVEGNPGPNSTITNLTQGVHSLSVADQFGCTTDTSVVISSLDGPFIESVVTTNDNCFSPAGSISIEASSSTSTLSYSIDGVNFASTPAFPNVAAGTYNVYVRDAFNCESIETAIVEIDPIPEILNVSHTAATCDLNNGGLEIRPNVTDGMEFSINGIDWSADLNYSGLGAGSYSVSMRDVNGCQDSEDIEIEKIDPVRIADAMISDASCLGVDGTIDVLTDQNAFEVLYALDGGAHSTESTFHGLMPGEYEVSIIDENGCVDSIKVGIGQVDGIELQSIETYEANCGRENGAFILRANNATDVQIQGKLLPVHDMIEGLPGGDYFITLVGEHNCRLDTMLNIPEVGCELFVPNVFSPNGDGNNELLAPQYDPTEVAITSFDIYDRWGTRVFSCSEGCAWDGTMNGEYVPAGVYVYYLRSESSSGVVVNQSGDITVLH